MSNRKERKAIQAEANAATTAIDQRRGGLIASLKRSVRRYYWLYLFILPTLIWYLVFNYAPMGGIIIAFKRYTGAKSIWESKWVGLKWFKSFFSSHYAVTTIRNTLLLSLYQLATFPLPIIFALMINEVRNARAKKVVQTVLYAPHFISTVVLVSMLSLFLSPQFGILGRLAKMIGMEPYNFMASAGAFRHIYVWSGVWQQLGWNCIIYVAALSSVDPALHEAATIDGANRLQRIMHINLPGIMPTVIITLILQVGGIMASNTDKVLLMINDLNASTAEVIGTYVYERGVIAGDFSYAAAVGLFTNVVNLILLLTVNQIARRYSDTSLF